MHSLASSSATCFSAIVDAQINLGTAFATAVDDAFNMTLVPAFSPYANDIFFLHGVFLFEDVGVSAYTVRYLRPYHRLQLHGSCPHSCERDMSCGASLIGFHLLNALAATAVNWLSYSAAGASVTAHRLPPTVQGSCCAGRCSTDHQQVRVPDGRRRHPGSRGVFHDQDMKTGRATSYGESVMCGQVAIEALGTDFLKP